jgi:hypothetical protein
VRGIKQRRLHKAFLRYHDPENWPLLRETLQRMGRADLIGNGKKHLIPAWQPQGTGTNKTASNNQIQRATRGRMPSKHRLGSPLNKPKKRLKKSK